MAKISIIVPVYNTAKYLERCIESIVAQTYADWELLLVDDGSNDRSGDICDRYAASDPRIQAFHKPNGGVSSARNLGLDHAQGEWITFVDADDWVEPNYLKSFGINDNCDISCTHIQCEGWKEWVSIPLKEYSGQINSDILNENLHRMNFPFAKIFRNSIIKNNNLKFNTKIHYGEDTLFVYSIMTYAKTIRTTPTAYYHYISYNSSNSLSKKHYSLESYLYTINQTCEQIERLEKIHNWNGYNSKNILVNNYLSTHLRYIKNNYNLIRIYKDLKQLLNNKYIKAQIYDTTSWKKSFERKLFDFFMKNKMYRVCSLYLYISRFIK